MCDLVNTPMNKKGQNERDVFAQTSNGSSPDRVRIEVMISSYTLGSERKVI
jgi:hypothetical protein